MLLSLTIQTGEAVILEMHGRREPGLLPALRQTKSQALLSFLANLCGAKVLPLLVQYSGDCLSSDVIDLLEEILL